MLEWGKSEWFAPFAGMTTRKVINRLNEVHSMGAWDYAGHLGNKLLKDIIMLYLPMGPGSRLIRQVCCILMICQKQ